MLSVFGGRRHERLLDVLQCAEINDVTGDVHSGVAVKCRRRPGIPHYDSSVGSDIAHEFVIG